MSRVDEIPFSSRRSCVLATHGAVSCNDSIAANIGLDLLKAGGTAADAAVATAAALTLTEPCSNGLGGDAFMLYYEAATQKVHAINGSGRAPAGVSLERVLRETVNGEIPADHGHAVNVPGAAACWIDTVQRHGQMSISEVLAPAIKLAEEGFPVPQIAAYFWEKGSGLLKNPRNRHGKDMLVDGEAPKWGQVFRNPHLANTFKALAQEGKRGFYEGRVGEAIAAVVREHGGVMTMDDLKEHTSTFEDPISVEYKGVRLWEVPPSGQGIVALMTLSILKNFDIAAMEHNSPEYLHTLIEAVRLSFKDALAYVADPLQTEVPIEAMIADSQGAKRSKLIRPDKALSAEDLPVSEGLGSSSDTTYFSVVDKWGNACSFIASNYKGFGTGIVPEGCGFTLQNRALNFSLKAGHPNVIAPNKRSYHTIIPTMLTDNSTGGLLACYGIMGGFMQPQAHVQVLLNMLHFHMDPQKAIDAPRFCVTPQGAGNGVSLEEGIGEEVVRRLAALGHVAEGPVSGHGRALFGRGHVITQGPWWRGDDSGIAAPDQARVWWAGADPRTDGGAVGY